MVQYIITPWRDRLELLQVKADFYPAPGKVDEEAQARAVERVSVWMQRGNCPHSVESTAILMSARLNDVPGNSNYCVRAAYSAAFSRFVTGLLDSHQSRKTKQSMYSLAKTLNPPLPATFVELRHQATHEELPSLPKLRLASQKALEWIWGYYWAGLSLESNQSETCMAHIQRLLRECDTVAREEIEKELEKWSDDELLATLVDIDETTDDPETLLFSTRMKKQILNSDGRSEASSVKGDTKGVEEMMAELVQMQKGLSESEEESEDDAANVGLTKSAQEDAGKGWQRWQGPWVPTPIGTIS